MESTVQIRTIAEQEVKPPYVASTGRKQALGRGRERCNVGKQRQDSMTRRQCLYKKTERRSSSTESVSEKSEQSRESQSNTERRHHLETPADLRTELHYLFVSLIEEISFLVVFIICIFVRLSSKLLLFLIPLGTLDLSAWKYKMVTPSDSSTPTGQLPGTSIRWIGAMPSPGSSGAPHFVGANVTEFLRRYHATCKDHGLDTKETIQRLPDYCDLTIGQYIRTIPWYPGHGPYK